LNRLESTWLSQIRSRGDGVQDCRVLVACSGGGDSTALLCFLWAVHKSLGLELIVAHANHGLRPEAAEDAAFVASLCRKLDLDCSEATLDVQGHALRTGQGLETAGRELRWAWLKAEATSCGASLVATGHTRDDHTETVLLRLARGGGVSALTPLPARQSLRWSPLIEVRREELRTYARQRGIQWREDPTNEQDFTPRNRWRKLLEPMRLEASALDLHLWETHRQVAELAALRDAQVMAWRGPRWDVAEAPARMLLRGTWTEVELRWALEAAFRDLDWHREAELLRDLSGWLLPHLGRRSRKPKTWGGWRLEPEAAAWCLKQEPGARKPSPDEAHVRVGMEREKT
jgi:tRNA(Ile)-lysidine synthetase-like protein